MKAISKILFSICALFSFVASAESYNLTRTARLAPSFNFECSTASAKIAHADVPNWSEIKCGNLSSTPVFLGDEDVDTVTSAAGRGWPICTDSAVCHGSVDIIGAVEEYCVASSPVVINCRVVRR